MRETFCAILAGLLSALSACSNSTDKLRLLERTEKDLNHQIEIVESGSEALKNDVQSMLRHPALVNDPESTTDIKNQNERAQVIKAILDRMVSLDRMRQNKLEHTQKLEAVRKQIAELVD